MASNYVIPEHYEDLTPAAELDKKTLNKMAWRSCFLQASFNYERMQACGWLYSILPGLQKIHTNKNDLAASMSHNLDFFNTHPFLVTLVMGIILSLESAKADIQTIRAVRVAAMGPLGGIGDALFWMTLVPITAGITSNMALAGNIAAPVIFLVVFNIVQFALRYWLMHWSYKMGTQAIDVLTENGKEFTRAASILGVFVVGCLTVTMGGTTIGLQIPNGTTNTAVATTAIVSSEDATNFDDMMFAEDGTAFVGVDASGATVEAGVVDLGNGMSKVTYVENVESPVTINIQEILDSICPKLVPLGITLGLYFLLAKKNFTPLKAICLVLVVGVLGSGFGILPSIW